MTSIIFGAASSERTATSCNESGARPQLSGWLSAVATWNPVTYVLEGLRSLVSTGWSATALGEALLAIVLLGVVSFSLCFAALRGRLRRG